MKLKTKHITVTAVMIALSIVVIQFIKAPLMIAGQNVASQVPSLILYS